MVEPAIAIAVSARDWPDRLRQSLADHGGARVRVTALTPDDLVAEEYSVLLIDDISSFLSRGLVEDQHRRGRGVVGVYDPDEPAGRDHLLQMGVDDVVVADATPQAFVAMLERTDVRASHPVDDPVESSRRAGAVVAVRGVSGGVGVTEVSFAVALGLGRSVAIDLAAQPSLAQRSSGAVHPNLATAAESVEHGDGDVSGSLQVIAEGTSLLAGVPVATHVGSAVGRVVSRVCAISDWSVLDLGRGAIPKGVPGPDIEVVVTTAGPVGVARCIDHLRSADLSSTHVVVNHAPRRRYECAEVLDLLAGEIRPRSLTLLRTDDTVRAASWNGTPVAGGPFARGVRRLVDHIRGAA